ncbi:MAG: PAS domain S-box protein [Candidatus Zixiibacteriota bacterium]|nr:MAG: PAS domain S-box protein [candidate division Zixibacteria bacterium]
MGVIDRVARIPDQPKPSMKDDLFRLALESLPYPFCLIDAADFTVRVANSAAGVDCGSSPVKCFSALHRRNSPCSTVGEPCPIDIIKKTKLPTVVEHVHPDIEGNQRYFAVSGYPVFDNRGDVVAVIEYAQDVTQRRLAEDALKESEAKWRSVVEHAPDLITAVDRTGRILFINRPPCGAAADDVIGGSVYDLIPSEHRSMVQAAIEQVFETGRADSYEIPNECDDGTTRWHATRLGPIMDGETVAAVILMTRDVSERKSAERLRHQTQQELEGRVVERTAKLRRMNEQLKEENARREQVELALRQSEELYRVILGNISDAILVADDTGKLTWVCANPDNIFGYSFDEMTEGMDIAGLLGNDLYDDGQLERDGELPNIRVEITDRDGHIRTLLVNVKRVNIKGGTVMFTCRDITRLDRTEKALRDVNEELNLERETLRQKNLALKEILSQIEDEKKRLATQIHLNVNRVVLPVVNALAEKAGSEGEHYIALLKSCLIDLTSPFVSNLERDFANLTPRELEICEMIKTGFTSKQIAGALNNSVETVLKQRKIIRRKLGISKKDINLVTYLKSLDRAQ